MTKMLARQNGVVLFEGSVNMVQVAYFGWLQAKASSIITWRTPIATKLKQQYLGLLVSAGS
jgi:hypothetical protein